MTVAMPWLEPHAQGGLRSQQAIHDFGELGQALVHDRPHDLQVHAEVAVDENVAHARHQVPGDLRRLCLGRRGDPLGRLADDLEVADHRILQQRRGEEGLLALVGVAVNPVNRVANMQQVGTVVPQLLLRPKGAGLRKDRVPQVRRESLLRHHVHWDPNRFLDLLLESDEVEEIAPGLKAYEKIKVSGRPEASRSHEPKTRTSTAPWRWAMSSMRASGSSRMTSAYPLC